MTDNGRRRGLLFFFFEKQTVCKYFVDNFFWFLLPPNFDFSDAHDCYLAGYWRIYGGAGLLDPPPRTKNKKRIYINILKQFFFSKQNRRVVNVVNFYSKDSRLVKFRMNKSKYLLKSPPHMPFLIFNYFLTSVNHLYRVGI